MVAFPNEEIRKDTADRFGELLRHVATPWIYKRLFRCLGEAMRDQKLKPEQRELAALFWDAM